jgi:fatty acid desaturase
MAAWSEVLGGSWILLGGYLLWRDSRLLVSPPYRRCELSRAGRRGRRKALTDLRRSLAFIALGVVWLTGWYSNLTTAWLLGGYVIVLVTYDLGTWLRSRKKGKSDSQAGELA